MSHLSKEKAREYNRKWRAKNKERLTKAQKEYAIANRQLFRDASKRFAIRNPEKAMLNTSRQNARKKRQEHSITLKDIVIPDKCPVFNVPFERGTERTASIDRIDNSKGYVPGNIQIISKRANMMKYDANIPELLMFAEWIIKTYGDK